MSSGAAFAVRDVRSKGHACKCKRRLKLKLEACMMQLKPAVTNLMAAVRALPPMSMDAVNAAAWLALPQIGCSNPRWEAGSYIHTQLQASYE